MASRARLIFNPASGRGKSKQRLLPQLVEELRNMGLEAEPAPTQEPGHATALAREASESGMDLVLAWGGDGTLNEVVAGMLGSTTPLALLPGGSVNVFARVAGIPRRLKRACRMLPHAEPRSIPVGLANGRPFLLMAGIGLDAEVVHRLGLGVKQKMGALGFWLKGFAMLAAYPFSSMTVRVEATEYLATSVIVGKTHLYGGRYVITPEARLEEPLFDVVLFQGRRGIDYLRYMVGVIGGFHLRFKDVVHIQTDQLEVLSRQPIHYQVDGELAGKAPVTVGICPHTVRFLLPPLGS